MNHFFAKNPYAGSSLVARRQAIRVVENNINWILDREKDVANSLLGPFKDFKYIE